MAENLGLQVEVGANIKPLTKGLADARKELATTAAAAQKTDSSLVKMGGGLSVAGNLAKTAASNISGLASSMISGGLITAIALAGAALFSLGEKLSALSESQKLANTALESGKDEYVKATLLVDKLKDRVQLAKDGIISKEMALREYNSTMGKTTGAVKNLDEAEKELINNGPKYIQYTLLKAAAQFTAKKAAEKLFEAELRNAKAAQVNSKISTNDKDGIGEFVKRGEENIRRKNRLDDQAKVDQLKSIAESFDAQAAEIAKGFKKTEAVTVIGGKKIVTETKAYVNEIKRSGLLPQSDLQGLSLGTGATLTPTVVVKPKIDFIITPGQDQKILDGLNEMFAAERLAAFQATATDAINLTISNILNDTISTMADSIAAVLSGDANAIDGIFDNLIKGIGGQIKELGKYLVKVGLEMLFAKEAVEKLGLTPTGVIIAGFGLQILGALLTAAATKKTKQVGFATGVRNFEGGVAMVGERGPELVTLPRGSSVIPNNETTAYSGGGGITLQPSMAYSGTDLRIFLNKVDAQMGRNN